MKFHSSTLCCISWGPSATQINTATAAQCNYFALASRWILGWSCAALFHPWDFPAEICSFPAFVLPCPVSCFRGFAFSRLRVHVPAFAFSLPFPHFLLSRRNPAHNQGRDTHISCTATLNSKPAPCPLAATSPFGSVWKYKQNNNSHEKLKKIIISHAEIAVHQC